MNKVYIDENGEEYPANYTELEVYKQHYELLLEKLAERDELAKILKIAHPAKVAEVRKAIAAVDDLIEDIEELLDLHKKAHARKIYFIENLDKLIEMTDLIEQGLREKLAKEEPEELEVLDALLSGDDKTH